MDFFDVLFLPGEEPEQRGEQREHKDEDRNDDPGGEQPLELGEEWQYKLVQLLAEGGKPNMQRALDLLQCCVRASPRPLPPPPRLQPTNCCGRVPRRGQPSW